MRPRISVIIPNYNGEKFLKDCLTSVLKSKFRDFEVLLRDDGSKDKSLEIIRSFAKQDKRIKFSQNRQNIGAAATRNLTVKEAKGELLMFLDNDTKIEPTCLTQLVKLLDESPTVGGAMAKIKDMEQPDLIQVAGSKLWKATGWGLYSVQMKKDGPNSNKVELIVPVSAALMLKKTIFEEVGGFDEKEGVYTEDLDFCWRIWTLGYHLVYCPQAVVYHFSKSVSDRKMMNANYKQIYFHLAKNSFRSIIKNYELINVLRFLPESLLINLIRAALIVIKRGDISALVGTLEAILWNLDNFSETISKRRYVQTNRRSSDRELFKLIFVPMTSWEIYNRYYSQTKLI